MISTLDSLSSSSANEIKGDCHGGIDPCDVGLDWEGDGFVVGLQGVNESDTFTCLWHERLFDVITACDRQKSYTDGKLNPRYIGPFKILAKDGTIVYRLELPEQLSRVHSMFHVSNLKKCLSDETLAIPLDGIQIDDKL
ncbi:hypothetical protein Tco_0381753 [Tanacetum coccineum]